MCVHADVLSLALSANADSVSTRFALLLQRAASERMVAIATATATATAPSTGRRKRKRKVLAQELAVAAPSGSLQEATRSLLAPSRPASTDMVCPIRVNVDVDGVRYQDTFLLNAYVQRVTD